MVRILGVSHGITHAAAVGLAADAAAVADTVTGRGCHKGDVDVHFTGFDGPRTAAVGTDNGRGLQLAGGNNFTDPAADAAGLDTDDLALFDVVGNRIVGVAEAGCGDGQIFQAQFFDRGLHDHVDDIVAVPQMMMEAEGHAALRTALTQGISQGSDNLGFLRSLVSSGLRSGFLDVLAVHVILALIDFLAVYQQFFRDVSAYCILHTRSPSYIPYAFARRRVRSAPGRKAMSIILPSTVNTPRPLAAFSRTVRTIFSAWMTSFSDGA